MTFAYICDHAAMNPTTSPYRLFNVPAQYFDAMLEDIARARKYVYLQIYKFYDDEIGKRFREALIKKAKEGVEVKLLIDSWGANIPDEYFKELTSKGGQVRIFLKIKFVIDFFTKNHRRNHRKLLVIDDKISWIGSANITAYSLTWRELMLRMEGELAVSFRKVFSLDFRLYNKYFFEKNSYIRLIRHLDFQIVRDVPSITKKRINKKFIQMIRHAEREILIETPYFLPGYFLRKALMDACKRGVDVTVVVPRHSDVMLVDILRNRYIGPLNQGGLKFLYYQPGNLHSKAILVDNELFAVGSPNFDYRSFRYMHEIILVGREQSIIGQLSGHIRESISNSLPFDYEKWLKRPKVQMFIEWLLLPFRHFF
jgi:cardiolipin synthase